MSKEIIFRSIKKIVLAEIENGLSLNEIKTKYCLSDDIIERIKIERANKT